MKKFFMVYAGAPAKWSVQVHATLFVKVYAENKVQARKCARQAFADYIKRYPTAYDAKKLRIFAVENYDVNSWCLINAAFLGACDKYSEAEEMHASNAFELAPLMQSLRALNAACTDCGCVECANNYVWF